MPIVRQPVRHVLVRSALFLLLSASLMAASAAAHPGSGIVVDRQGQIYFVDTGKGVWTIDTQGKLTPYDGPPHHWMTIDLESRFKKARFPPTGSDLRAVGENPTLILSSDFPITVGQDGALYYPGTGSDQRVRIHRLTADGQRGVLATLPASTESGPLRWLNGMATGPDGSIYYTENRAVRKVDPKGQIATVASNVAVPDCARPPGYDAEGLGANLRGLDVAADGAVYVAASGCAALLKITPDGKVAPILRMAPPWTPTGAAVSGTTVYVLEYFYNESHDRRDWVPRVRKITSDGKDTILASVTR